MGSPITPVRISDAALQANEREWGALSDLIGRIYEASVDPTRWDDALTHITAALSPSDWNVAMLLWERSNPPGGRFVAATGVGTMIREIYASTFAGRNPWSLRISPQPLGRVVDTFDIMSRSELVEHPIYASFLQVWGLERALGVILDRRGNERLGLILPGPPDRDLTGLTRGLRLLAPHLQRAVRISHALGEANLRLRAATAALERSPVAVITLTRDLTVMNANDKARDQAKAGWMTLAGDRLSFHDRSAQRSLLGLASASPPATAAFSAANRQGDPLAVLGARLTPQVANTLAGDIEGAAIVLTIGLGERTPLLEVDRLGAWYGLTPAEGRLTAALVAGATPTDYAKLRDISINAVRFLLKSIYRKTGAAGQAQLVATVRALPTD